MSPDRLSQALVDMTRGRLRQSFEDDPAATVDATGLPDELATAIKDHDFARLRRAGAHPMALLYLSRAVGCSLGEYLRQLEQAEAGR